MLDLIPYPKKILHEFTQQCLLPGTVCLDNDTFAPWCVCAFLERTEITIDTQSSFCLKLEQVANLRTEEYTLKITADGLRIRASCEQGVIWALVTVANLMEGGRLPCCEIEDAPQYYHRGLSLDCARHFFPAVEVKKIVEQMSLAKMNVLHWHLSDDQGWRIESRKFPLLHETSGEYFTQEEISGVVEFARLRGVEVIPEIDLPGHTTAILSAYPQYSCSGEKVRLAESGGIFRTILCAGKDATFAFLTELLDEICPLFPSPRFHIGGDEAPKNKWQDCPECNRRMREQGLASIENLQGWFSQRVAEILHKHGKSPVCWNDILQAGNPPQDTQIQYWSVNYADTMRAFLNNGGKFIYSDMFELYFDYPYSMTPMKKVYSCTPHIGREQCPFTSGIIGVEACIWCEHISDPVRLEQLLFPRIFALAENMWSGQATDYTDFLKRVAPMVDRAEQAGVSCTPKSWWDPKGRSRRKEAISYFTAINSGMSKEIRKQTVESARPNREFAQSFMNQFFRKQDMPFLLAAMLKKS